MTCDSFFSLKRLNFLPFYFKVKFLSRNSRDIVLLVFFFCFMLIDTWIDVDTGDVNVDRMKRSVNKT